MKQLVGVLLAVLLLCGCVSGGETLEAVMVDGVIYYSSGKAIPAEVDPSAILGQIHSICEGNPEVDGQANFAEALGCDYARSLDPDGVVVLLDHEWILFEPMK